MQKGQEVKAFHPRTLGVMHRGIITKVWKNNTVSVRFDIDGKTYRIPADHAETSW